MRLKVNTSGDKLNSGNRMQGIDITSVAKNKPYSPGAREISSKNEPPPDF